MPDNRSIQVLKFESRSELGNVIWVFGPTIMLSHKYSTSTCNVTFVELLIFAGEIGHDVVLLKAKSAFIIWLITFNAVFG